MNNIYCFYLKLETLGFGAVISRLRQHEQEERSTVFDQTLQEVSEIDFETQI